MLDTEGKLSVNSPLSANSNKDKKIDVTTFDTGLRSKVAARLGQAIVQAKAYEGSKKKRKNESEISGMLAENVK